MKILIFHFSTAFKMKPETKKEIVGVGVLDDPSGKSNLDGQIFLGLPPCGGRDVGDAIPYDSVL